MVASGAHRGGPLTDVLVIGAGPTGLTLALQAHAHGARVRVVERRPEPFRPSRAMIVHPRTMECLRPLGVTDALLDRGDRSPRAELHLGSRVVKAALGELPMPDTAFPHLTMLRQMDVEEVLAGALAARGVQVERGTELVDLVEREDDVVATLRTEDGIEETNASWVAGCDGPASTVRGFAGIGWHGDAYGVEVVLADVELDGSLTPGVVHVVAGREGLVFVFALGERTTWRVLATRPAGPADQPFGQPGQEVPVTDVQALLDVAGLDARVTEMPWSARVRLQHRLADSFRQGRLFLAGDAAHAHSPAAAQGMNTGILDATNLGWKLAFAGADGKEALLGSYETERRPVAREVLALTHAVFFAEASNHPLPSFLRGTVVPLLAPALPLLVNQPTLMAEVVKVLSQRWVRYRRSPISMDGTPAGGGTHPGDRLPDEDIEYDGRAGRLHDLTAGPGVHVVLEQDAEPLDTALLGEHVTVHRITSRQGSGLVAVRPDGHVGFRCGTADVAQLGAWLDLVGAR